MRAKIRQNSDTAYRTSTVFAVCHPLWVTAGHDPHPGLLSLPHPWSACRSAAQAVRAGHGARGPAPRALPAPREMGAGTDGAGPAHRRGLRS
ncbi:conserved hypothetical protein [Streptomyces pristinaespiralis ATCC 25486]|uniref:Uncharacterized protein n=1 Tax=Streptomyces pristinaespiralis (strain ATCC 25486 / DSM 40338 / CBS 914.69 / JCM 4507 / KCC S-0507 / NBRC 13074 / NRRL 2958 / 5647) TaxID=457429 RepID=B5HK61_STRE2|nr:conserved hypothetical protein [Streptomyces pristinaespiralis ATCC 25486]